MRTFRFSIAALLLFSVAMLGVQAPAQAPAGTVRLSGVVKDSTEGVMASVDVKVFQGEKLIVQGTTDRDGGFEFNVPPGQYRVEVSAVDFTPAKPTVQAVAGMPPLQVTLTLAALATIVNVNTTNTEVGVDPESSLAAQTITGEALLDLPENEEDLEQYLQNLAARVGGAETANIVIDGFTEGQLPSRDQIAEIRIVNNAFSAEGAGGGPRIEIVTRSGTGRWRGNLNFSFNDESLNASNAFTGRKPARQTRNYTTNVDGPIVRNKLTLGFQLQNNESEGSAQSVRAVTENGPVSFVLSSPDVRRTYGLRNVRYSITPTNTLNFSGNMTRSDGENQGVSGFNLPSRATETQTRNWQVQISDRATIGNTIVHEIRFQSSRNKNSTNPVSNAMVINVADAFISGGSSNRNSSESRNYQLANTLTWQLFRGRLNIRTGGQMDYRRSENNSQQNYNGTYNFANLHDYCWAINFNGTNCVQTEQIVNDAIAAGETPKLEIKNSAGEVVRTLDITGYPTRYTRTFGDPYIGVSQAEFSTFVQADWRLNPRAQLQTGLRYQAQQHLNDYNNLAPTIGLNYQVRTSQNWRSVVRVGGRVSHQTFSMNSYQQLLQSDGVSRQFHIDILNPLFDPVNGPPVDSTKVTGSSTSVRVRPEDYVVGYAINTSATWEQSLPKQMAATFTFERTRGVHNNRNRNINAPYPGTRLSDEILALLNSNNPNPAIREQERARGREMVNLLRPLYPNVGNVIQMEPTGNSIDKRVNVNFRTQNRNYVGNRINLGANVSYSYSWGYDDNNPVNPYDIVGDWGISNRQHRVNGQAQLSVYQNSKWKNFRLMLQPTWNSGRPYSITLGRDENGDSNTNDRPFGIARNTLTGPTQFNVNMSFSKTFYVGLGGGSVSTRNYAEPQGGGGFGGGFGGGGGGFGGGGGGNRGGFGNNINQSGTQITLSANVNNLLNRTQLNNYSGVLTSAFFGRANTSSNERRITLQMSIRYQ